MQEVLKTTISLPSTMSPRSYAAPKLTYPTFLPARFPAFRGSPTSPWAAESLSGETGSTSGRRATSSSDLAWVPNGAWCRKGGRSQEQMALKQPRGLERNLARF
jgi:hypothetical protein